MRYASLSVLFLAAALAGVFVACGSTAPKCSPAVCSGCCTSADECVTGNSPVACGSAGNLCIACSAGTSCEFGVCRTQTTGTGGGSGATGGGGGATGGGAGTGGGSATGGGGGTTGGGGGTTGGGGGGATGGGGGGSTLDAGMVTLDAGTTALDGGALNPPTIALTFAANCGALTRCPGSEVGTWVYSAGCIEDSAFSRVTSAAAQAGCTATVSNKNGSIAGAVVFDGTDVRRTVAGLVNFHLSATGSFCLQACSFIPSQLGSFGVSGTCAPALSTCECDLSFDIGDMSTQSYTYVDGRLSAGAETYDSCITNNTTLRYRETTDGGIPGLFTLTTP